VSKKRSKPHRKTTTPRYISWEFPPDVPTSDFFEGQNPIDHGDLECILDDFISCMESKGFLAWEAVVCEERGIRLSKPQKDALADLFGFDDDDEILYINESPRPSQPWYEIFRIIATNLMVDGPFETYGVHYTVVLEGWPRLKQCVHEYAADLSLPQGVESAFDLLPEETVHRLDLQCCFDELSGLGQDSELTLENEDQVERVEWFIQRLQQTREAVAYFDLTLESLLTRVRLPERDLPIFVTLTTKQLGLTSPKEPLVDRLDPATLKMRTT
jgi:hypothetical protein